MLSLVKEVFDEHKLSSARRLGLFLGYSEWQEFEKTVLIALGSMKIYSEYDVNDHIRKEGEDYTLSMLGFLTIVVMAEPTSPGVKITKGLIAQTAIGD